MDTIVYMSRPKEFDRDDALRSAVRVFWRRGYAGTTASDLVEAMGIGRQSFYDTFGDKRACYLEALRTYAREEVDLQLATVGAMPDVAAADPDTGSPLETLRAFLRFIADRPDERRLLGCMVVNALAEGGEESDVAKALGPSSRRLKQGVVGLLRAAKARGDVDPALDEGEAAHALLVTRMGLMLSAKAGQPREQLRRIADFAVDQLARHPASNHAARRRAHAPATRRRS